MNASSNVSNVEIANKIASTAALFRKYFPDASVNFSPWENSNNESMQDTIDFAFHFPGWSPLIECRAILLQLRIENVNNEDNSFKVFRIVICDELFSLKARNLLVKCE